MLSDFTLADTIFVGSVALSCSSQSVVFAGVTLQVVVANDCSTTSVRGFLFGVRTSLTEPRFRLGCREENVSSVAGF